MPFNCSNELRTFFLRYDEFFRVPFAKGPHEFEQFRMIPEGTGGSWRTAGIVDASEAFGPGTWLVAVQARNDRSSVFDGHGGGGQLLLMRTSVWNEAKKKR